MRRRLLLAPVLVSLAAPTAAGAQSGGAAVPAPTGGATYGDVPARLTATRFAVAPGTLQPGAPATFRYRIDGAQRTVRVRIDLLPAGGRRPAKRLRLGYKRTGRTYRYTWKAPTGALTPGDYVARLVAVDRAGRGLRRTARASGKSALAIAAPAPPPPVVEQPVTVGSGVFPLRGAYRYGEGFGVARGPGATHRGQDLLAAEGTPVATPRAGTVYFRAYQATGAGYYVVVRADDGRDFVFMHLKEGSIAVEKGAALGAGQVFAQAGNTGRSTAPHLHFEIWPQGWYAPGGSQPVDPLPDLKAWGG